MPYVSVTYKTMMFYFGNILPAWGENLWFTLQIKSSCAQPLKDKIWCHYGTNIEGTREKCKQNVITSTLLR